MKTIDIVTTKQILDTLDNMWQEIEVNGLTTAADDMWMHALTMHRASKAARNEGEAANG